eukprot:GEMP01003420.1.p1 GENE.GEMP01003420.1~~GEMP01003420.1.p1  ORF type:complete len:1218 (+),score=213.16 GEMP01003420.1:145-3798(+)
MKPNNVAAVSSEADVKNYQTLLEQACCNHVGSFNLFLDHSLDAICTSLPRLGITPKRGTQGETLYFWFHSLNVRKPTRNSKSGEAVSVLYPSDCRLAHTTYCAPLCARVKCRLGENGPVMFEDIDLGFIPIMVMSKRCNLYGASKEELTRRREDPSEKGGYFIINGNEKVVRLLIQQKTNYIIALVRPSFENRGKMYSKYATQMRCMRKDLTTLTNTLHYCRDGTCFFRFSHEKNEWLIPLIVVCFLLYDCTESHVYQALTGGGTDHYLVERVTLMLQRQQESKIPVNSQATARRFLGKRFRHMMRNVSDNYSDERAGAELAKDFFFVHTENGLEKFESLCLMYLKLTSLVRGKIEPDNCDALSLQDALLPGQLYGAVLKEALEEHLHRTRGYFYKLLQKTPALPLTAQKIKDCMDGVRDIEKQLEYFLATGNIKSRTGLDLMQVTGFCIMADKLNAFRYLSHFRSIHRGSFFTELRTTTVRKLLPDTWGFLCPVHTPDGTPCGLLNHLAARCESVTRAADDEAVLSIQGVLRQCSGVYGVDDPHKRCVFNHDEYAWICLDGKPLARVALESIQDVVATLRVVKAEQLPGVPRDMEIVYISSAWDHLFPGIYMFSGPCRLIRPVQSLHTGQTEWVGPLEQIFLNVAVTRDDLKPKKFGTQTQGTKIGEQLPIDYSHVEIAPTEILSILASMTPFSNHNQSPRNMYQCQMLKQTMGTPYVNHTFRTDNKIYKIHAPQRPMVRTQLYGGAAFDDHPPGVNAVVAVISYTGYDMEDAMIINRGSLNRGFFHGHVYKQKVIHAHPEKEERQARDWKFRTFNPKQQSTQSFRDSKVQLEVDGFLPPGTKVTRGDVFACSISDHGQVNKESWKDDEDAYLEQINLIQGGSLPSRTLGQGALRASLKFRILRPPIVGDKFASRHGQKGVVAVTWPQEDMPFSESGMTPDILFNPHGFPSRMTVGMLIESIAGKAAALHGRKSADASTFRKYRGHYTSEDNNEDDPFLAKDAPRRHSKEDQLEGAAYFGKALAEKGFQYWGTEQLYNGMTGEMMPVQIFKGIIYYQRLRHMVSDKLQVRAVGRVDPLTKQPIKGRSKHGGIRFGEMERDSLLAHGTAFLLHDRLFRCSDYHVGHVCPECGSLLTAVPSAGSKRQQGAAATSGLRLLAWDCAPCSRKLERRVVCHRVPIPYVFRYLVAEMAAMNINLPLKLSNPDRAVEPSKVPLG